MANDDSSSARNPSLDGPAKPQEETKGAAGNAIDKASPVSEVDRAVNNTLSVLLERSVKNAFLEFRKSELAEFQKFEPYSEDTEVAVLKRRVSDVEYIVYGLVGFIVLIVLLRR